MHNLVPDFILENFAGGQRRGVFPAAGLFIDVSGFTSMTEALMAYGPHGAEVLATIMRAVFEPPVRSVYEQGGFVAEFAGDAFTALFPLEGSEAEVCKRALAAAYKLQGEMATREVYVTPYGDFRISARVGLAFGEVIWGIVTSTDERRAMYYFQGSAVEGCSAAEGHASAGEIILDDQMYSLLRDLVDAEAVSGHFRLSKVLRALPPARPVDEPASPAGLQERFFPPEVVQQAYSGEFRQVVNMFIRLPTVRTEQQLAIFMQSLFQLQDKYGGLLNRLDFGDKGSNLLIFWGAPVAYENDIERALNLVLDLQMKTSIPINAGITYQIAHVGFSGSPVREEYTCYGQGVNLAARFMTAAPRGEIWVDHGIAERAKGRFLFDFEGELAFKGFNKAQKVYVLSERAEQVEALFQGKLAGRETELERLAGFFAPLLERDYAGALVVWGEAGIGKSRLVHELRSSPDLKPAGFLWALCQTDQILREPFNPVRYWLRHYFGLSETQSESRNKRIFNQKVDGLIPASGDETLAAELDRTRSFLAALVGLHWPDSLYEQVDAQGRYENTLIGLTVLLQIESLIQPAIIQIEDAQWMDEATREFLPRLVRTLTSDPGRSYPIAIIATARPERNTQLLGVGLAFHEIELGELSGEELAKLAETHLGGPARADLLELLATRSEGNPFFAEQILAYLREEGLLERRDQAWTVKTHPVTPLPVDVRALLVARLDRLAQAVKEMVQTAAILGREFEVQILARMLKDGEELPEKIAKAEEAGIWSALSEMRYIFKHSLMRDTAYHTQVRSRRQALHALAVEALEDLYAADTGLHYGELAYHAEQANRLEKAIRYLELAGDAAGEVYQNSQAIDYYSRALSLVREADVDTRLHLLLARESLYDLMGAREAQRQELEALAALLEEAAISSSTQNEWRAEVACRQSSYKESIGDYQGAISGAQQAIDLATSANVPKLVVEAHITWSRAVLRTGDFVTAMQKAEAGLQLARASGDKRRMSRALNTLAVITLEREDTGMARAYLEQSLQIAQEMKARREEALPLSNLGIIAGNEGDFSAAQEYYERALSIARQIGHRRGEGIVLGNLGWIASQLGEFERARTYISQQLRITREVGVRPVEAMALINLSALSRLQGDLASAQEQAEQGLALALEIGDRSAEAWSLTSLGHIHFGRGDLAAARQAYKAAGDIRSSLEQPNLGTEPLAGLARVAMAMDELAAAQAHIAELLAYLEGGGTVEGTDEPLWVYLTSYHTLLAANDPRAGTILETAYDLLESRAEKISDPEKRRAFRENIPYHREILAAWADHDNLDFEANG